MRYAFLLCLAPSLFLFLAPDPVQGQQERVPQANTVNSVRPSDVVPADSGCYLALRRLDEAGIHTGFPFGTGGRRPWTRGEFAQAVVRITAPLADVPTTAVRQKLESRLRRSNAAREALIRLTQAFQPELRALGQNVPVIQERLVGLQPIASPFPDVPQGHWAYQAVETLRKAGIVQGETDRHFHG